MENKQGEDKGVMVIWPISLAVSFLLNSASSHASHQLAYIPDLPLRLRPSPLQLAAAIPAGSLIGALAAPLVTSLGG